MFLFSQIPGLRKGPKEQMIAMSPAGVPLDEDGFQEPSPSLPFARKFREGLSPEHVQDDIAGGSTGLQGPYL
jgi:hypothetical protein